MEIKINITNQDRTSIDQWKNLKGPNATRETRMEVVTWIAVCLFDCRLEGGFVRDWIVGNYTFKPTNLSINQWVSFHPVNGLPILNKDLVPSDLDLHLPVLKQFDIEAFVDTLYGYGITAQIHRQDWRYVLLHGMGEWQDFKFHEYIVYRYGQALPYLKITYKIQFPRNSFVSNLNK
jgi:hypothetical protein